MSYIMDTYGQVTQVSHDSWESICEELVDFGANASKPDLHLLTMYLEDSDAVGLPQHLERYGGLIAQVQCDEVALRNIRGMLSLFSDLQ